MDVQLDTLIKKIKDNGIAVGERSAKEMLAHAEEKAKDIINHAHENATHIIESAHKEAGTIVNRGKDGVKQAERDLVLTLEGRLKEMCNKYIANASYQTLSGDRLSDIISQALSKWQFGANDNIFIHLSEKDAQTITKEAISGAINAQGSTVHIVIDETVGAGFRISREGEGNYAFDFTAEAISDALSVFLTPNIQELLK